MTSESWLVWGLLFGSIGLGLFVYGRKQAKLVPKYCGIALMVYPYFVANVYWLVGVGVSLLAVTFFWRD